MGLAFEELNDITRVVMLHEFEREQKEAYPFSGTNLSSTGRLAFPSLVRTAIKYGDDESLFQDLNRAHLWISSTPAVMQGVPVARRLNVEWASRLLAQCEFNTWYVRGFSRRLLNEGERECEVYRAGGPKGSEAACCQFEGRRFLLEEVYEAHRAGYWPVVRAGAFSIPFTAHCDHSIRRAKRTVGK